MEIIFNSPSCAKRDEAVRRYEAARQDELNLEVLHDERASRQLRDIAEVGVLMAGMDFSAAAQAGPLPHLVRQWTKHFMAHAHWLEDPDDEFACHHSRYVRMYGEALSLTGFFNPQYRDFAVGRLEQRLGGSQNPGSVYMGNLSKRLHCMRDLAVRKVDLPEWPSQNAVAAGLRAFQAHAVFDTVEDVLEAVAASRLL